MHAPPRPYGRSLPVVVQSLALRAQHERVGAILTGSDKAWAAHMGRDVFWRAGAEAGEEAVENVVQRCSAALPCYRCLGLLVASGWSF
jgi:hypothetical protein